MSKEQKNEGLSRINIIVDKDFKNNVKKTILKNGITRFQDGYLEMLKKGLEVMKKNG